MPVTVGIRVDVDTFRGTRLGVPGLLDILHQHKVLATFFFTVGPDNMGRHLWRLIRPRFLIKMLRSRAAGLYGWDILLRGTLWPGPIIGERLSDVVRNTAAAGHEIGLHAWDHHRWQMHIDDMSPAEIRRELKMGALSLESILGRPVMCSAVAGWRCNEAALREKELLNFRYNSDCRGNSLFRPIIDDSPGAVQIPVTLPTYDEVIGHNGIHDRNYNEFILSLLHPDRLNVLTIHAEVEGLARMDLFREFLTVAHSRGVHFVPLRQLLDSAGPIRTDHVVQTTIPGRDGAVCWQASAAPRESAARSLNEL